MHVRTVSVDELPTVAAFVAEQQSRASAHIGYLDMDADPIGRAFRELEPRGLDGILVAWDGTSILGVLGAEWDTDPPRVWWHGPFAVPGGAWHEVADTLYRRGRGLLPAEIEQEELAPDERNVAVGAFAQRHGFHAEEGSAVLARALEDDERARDASTADVTVRPLEDDDLAAVAAMHDALFPGAHTTGQRLGETHVLVAHRERPVGYVAFEVQDDGEGYIDFVGVAPQARRTGVGALLVRSACRELRDRGCTSAHLTVRASKTEARRLYDRLGFAEERVLVPWRRGFAVRAGK